MYNIDRMNQRFMSENLLYQTKVIKRPQVANVKIIYHVRINTVSSLNFNSFFNKYLMVTFEKRKNWR